MMWLVVVRYDAVVQQKRRSDLTTILFFYSAFAVCGFCFFYPFQIYEKPPPSSPRSSLSRGFRDQTSKSNR